MHLQSVSYKPNISSWGRVALLVAHKDYRCRKLATHSTYEIACRYKINSIYFYVNFEKDADLINFWTTNSLFQAKQQDIKKQIQKQMNHKIDIKKYYTFEFNNSQPVVSNSVLRGLQHTNTLCQLLQSISNISHRLSPWFYQMNHVVLNYPLWIIVCIEFSPSIAFKTLSISVVDCVR